MTTRAQLDRAVAAGIVTAGQAEALARLWAGEEAAQGAAPPRGRFDAAHVLWYLGALIVIGAMGAFQTIAWDAFGPGALALIALAYGAAFALAGDRLWRRGHRVPGGLLVTVAVTMVPLAVYALQSALGWWGADAPGRYPELFRYIKGGWFGVELATILASALALRFYRFPFLLMPAAVALWFLSMDVVALTGAATRDWDRRADASLLFGLGAMIAAWRIDLKARADFAFWLHLFGGLAFWSGLFVPLLWRDGDWTWPALASIALLALSVFLDRRVYAVLGGIGLFAWLWHLSREVFGLSFVFPFMLSAAGVALIALGLALQRRREAIAAWLERRLPPALAALRPPHARRRG